VCRIRHIFKWGVENELVCPTRLQALKAVQGLEAGRCEAPDNPPRRPVTDEDLEKVRGGVSELVRDLIDLQLLTGARSGERGCLTTVMLDRSRQVWLARLTDHKTIHRGKERVLVFGPKAQLILQRYLKAKPDQRLFAITTDGYRRAVTKACKRLK